jgi:hypothetical protein
MRGRVGYARRWLGAFTLVLLFALPVARASALNTHIFSGVIGEKGSGAGQVEGPAGVAVDDGTHDVYVADPGNDRVDEFEADGAFVRAFGGDVGGLGEDVCTLVCQAGTSGSSLGEFVTPTFVAVDNSPGGDGDVYVGDTGDGVVTKFSASGVAEGQLNGSTTGAGSFGAFAGIAVGTTGTFYVFNRGTHMFEFEQGGGGFIEEFQAVRETGPGGLAVDGEGDFFKVNGDLSVEELTGADSDVGQLTAGVIATGLAADTATGDLYVASSGLVSDYAFSGPGEVVIPGGGTCTVEPHVGCAATDTFGSGEASGPGLSAADGIAVDSSSGSVSSGSVYVADAASDEIVVFAAAVRPDVTVEPPVLTPTSATLKGTVKPDGVPLTSCEFEYASEAEYAVSKTYGQSVACTPGASEIPSGAGEVTDVSADLSSLQPDSVYHFRLSAGDVNGTSSTADEGLTTPGPGVRSESVADVRSTSATFEATIDPHGTATSYYFQYGPSTQYGSQAPVAPGEAIGSGETPLAVSQHVQDLVAGEVYHYRVVTVSYFKGTLEELPGEGKTLTTQTGGEAGLPDHREWQLVSPPDKHGALLLGIGESTFVQAAADGHAIVYGASGPTESQPHGHAEHTQVLSSRGVGTSAWESQDLLAPHTTPVGAYGGDAYRLFSSDLSAGVLQPQGSFEPALSPEATEQTVYLRDSSTGVLTPLVTRSNDTTEPFVPFGGEAEGECSVTNFCPPNFQGATPDLSHIILGDGIGTGIAPLLKGANANELYEWAGGKLSLISTLPVSIKQSELAGGPFLGGGTHTAEVFTHAISEDGSRAFWQEKEAPPSVAFLLFMHDSSRGEHGETIQIGSGEAIFEGANASGSLVFYSGKECEVILCPSCLKLKCEPVIGENHKPLEDGTVLAASEDGSIVYFKNGQSIYVRHGNGEAKLIASNIGQIRAPTAESGIHPPKDPWRASPNGEWFAFMSDSPLTGYDNRDALTGAPDEEVYLYSAAAQRLVCASCDPTGERPHGTAAVHLNLADYAGIAAEQQPVAATIPGWAPYVTLHAVYDPRFLSDSGRLFFNATDGLVPKDINGQVDVYELEPPGIGSCTTSTSTGSDIYVPAAAGCVALISSGESSEESVFEDASETGEDVFFLSLSRLSTTDLDGSLSMWDAQVCTTSNPCPPAPTSQPSACDNEASCKASPSPQPTIYQPPASATLNAPSNPTPPPPPPATKPKPKPKPKACTKRHAKHKKPSCKTKTATHKHRHAKS